MNTISEKSKQYAIRCHTQTNHLYNGLPYHEAHLQPVVDTGIIFLHLIPEPDRDNVLGGLWVHDIIEDCRETWNDVKKETNEEVANLAYALTNEKGKTRSERANSKYYKGIRKTKNATFIKLSDRIANVFFSYQNRNLNKGGMFSKYKSENGKFIYELVKPEWYQLWEQTIRLITPEEEFITYRINIHPYRKMIYHLQDIMNRM